MLGLPVAIGKPTAGIVSHASSADCGRGQAAGVFGPEVRYQVKLQQQLVLAALRIVSQ